MKQMLFEASSVRPSMSGLTPFLAFRAAERRLDDYLSGMGAAGAASRDAGKPLIVSGPSGFCVFPRLDYLTMHPDSPLHGVDVLDMWDEDGRLFAADPGRGDRGAVEVRQLTGAGIDSLKTIVASDGKLAPTLPWFDNRGYAEAGPRALDSLWHLWDDENCCRPPRCVDGMSSHWASPGAASVATSRLITEEDVHMLVARVDDRLKPHLDPDDLEEGEDVYHLGDWGYVRAAEYERAFEGEPEWARDMYMLDGNEPDRDAEWADIYNGGGMKALGEALDRMFDEDRADYVYYTTAEEPAESLTSSDPADPTVIAMSDAETPGFAL